MDASMLKEFCCQGSTWGIPMVTKVRAELRAFYFLHHLKGHYSASNIALPGQFEFKLGGCGQTCAQRANQVTIQLLTLRRNRIPGEVTPALCFLRSPFLSYLS